MANFNFNKVILGGRLTADPELKTTTSGIVVTSFSIAVTRRFAKNAEGQANQQSDFINCVAWRNQAEFITRYFRKGSSICITGSLQTRTWTDQQNNKRYVTEVVVDEVNFVDSKSENSSYQNSSDNFGAPSYSTDSAPDFEVISGDQDLPF
ncbi:MAG: single-stranded DNA-binding protein [Clostridia bacterium]|nr:single-stranded DNA-binding protein [Oscillospiraceae bacterium]MBQ6702913.1 single-stranded DNA-binding protein [Clostridia bacterium]